MIWAWFALLFPILERIPGCFEPPPETPPDWYYW